MHDIKIPNNISKQIENTKWNYGNIFRHDLNRSIIPLAAWDKMCKLKCEGGMGIRRNQDVNAALLG